MFDLPKPCIFVTEHRIQKKCCPNCQTLQQASFPDQVKAPTQYGASFASWTTYLNMYQMIPLERISQFFHDLTGYRPSEATLLTTMKRMSEVLEPFEGVIRNQLLESPVVHADETGLLVERKGHWLHVMSNSDWTLIGVNESRGSNAIKELDFLPRFTNTLVHDCYATYFKEVYNFLHALCNAHLLRECIGIETYDNQPWATDMKAFLQESWEVVKKARTAGVALEEEVLQAMEARYDGILIEGQKEWATGEHTEHVRPAGRKKKSKAANLGQRLQLHKEAILRFIRDAYVPFDNNQAERDIRMVKIKIKVSGSYRTLSNAMQFARIRSIIATFRKQNLPILSSLTSAFKGQFSF
ncbi:transposase [Paenibacillus baekrokdamisoli]|uniref:Transposase n=1 Tax=Paenibacillus baekrokdamisoli TaxID=1712516 RepID=A0A3G9JHR2_9BACL|nr:hypothetical protein [Paenibacillus baekrokdamisoli]BBH22574.1 transposase [Paenibacillus baekrokdamisoli]